MSPERFDRMIQAMYRSAVGRQPWDVTLQSMADSVDASFAQLIAVEKSTGRLALSMHSREAPIEGVLDYMREYHKHDPHVAHGLTLRVGELFHTAELISPSEARGLIFYRDFWSIYDVRYALMGKVFEDDSVVAMYAVLRPPTSTGFSKEQAQLVRRSMGYLSETFQLGRDVTALKVRAQVGQHVIDRISRPCILIDSNRVIVHCNADASRLLTRADLVVSRAGHIGCRRTTSDAVLLQELTALQLDAPVRETRTDRRAFALKDQVGRAVPACLWALRPNETLAAFGDSALALLMLPTESGESRIDPYILEACFDLTPAEGRILSLLAQGLDLSEAAASLTITKATARSHLRSIFDKTGIHSQVALLRQVDKLLSLA